jgi:hypothetical protein
MYILTLSVPVPPKMMDSTAEDICAAQDARQRFSHTKAIFEQLANSEKLPSFYSPRPQRHQTLGSNAHFMEKKEKFDIAPKCAPPVPPKPQNTDTGE